MNKIDIPFRNLYSIISENMFYLFNTFTNVCVLIIMLFDLSGWTAEHNGWWEMTKIVYGKAFFNIMKVQIM